MDKDMIPGALCSFEKHQEQKAGRGYIAGAGCYTLFL